MCSHNKLLSTVKYYNTFFLHYGTQYFLHHNFLFFAQVEREAFFAKKKYKEHSVQSKKFWMGFLPSSYEKAQWPSLISCFLLQISTHRLRHIFLLFFTTLILQLISSMIAISKCCRYHRSLKRNERLIEFVL